MWLVGAGASVAAGVPSARQMVDDFKAIIYATIHKVPLDSINLGEPGTRSRVQVFFDTHPGLPSASDPDEYSRAFEAACPSAKDRRNYIESQISKGRPAFGNMGLAVLAALERIRIVWTTNFDRVIEDSANAIMTLPARLTVAALETSDIAVQAIA